MKNKFLVIFLTLVALLFASKGLKAEEEFSDDDENFEDFQTEFYLPYSETEDVDFNIVRPGGQGCYQW